MKEKDYCIILGDPEEAEKIKHSLIEKYGKDHVEVKTVFAEEFPVKNLLEEIESVPLFSKRKIIHIKNCENMDNDSCKLLKKFFENPPPDVYIIVSGKKIKSILAEYVDITKKETAEGIFPAIYRMRNLADKRKVISLLKEYIKHNPYEVPKVINASSIYLRNLITRQNKVDKKILLAYAHLQELDFKLKTGRIDKEDVDIFLFSILNSI